MRPEAQTFVAHDGRELTFLFDHRGIVAAEKAGEAGFGALLVGMGQGQLGALAAVVYGGLKPCHPTVTIEEAWDLLEGDAEEAMGLALGEAIKASRPGKMALKAASAEGKAAAEARPPKATPKRGTRSSPRGSRKV